MKNLFTALKFSAKENNTAIFTKKYADDYAIEIDCDKQTINYGDKIICESKATCNFSQPENFVVLECVNRLLEKGYKPENITLEKTWSAGHGTSGRLDICVSHEDGSEYLLIECKTYGNEFEKAVKKLNKDGGQLFTYFKFSNKADVIMLYASELQGENTVYKNEIIKIEDDYRTGDAKDFYEKWNKLTKNNGIFEDGISPYNFQSKAITINELVEIKQEDSSFIFNQFLEVLRHNVVSDKGNAFNRIFTLFLCKIYDEKINEGTNNELGFQWFNAPFQYDGVHYPKDDHRTFQIRLTDLYKNGMHEFLEKKVTDFSQTEFNNRFNFLTEEQRKPILEEFHRIRLEKNNEFAIKDVYDAQSFEDNAVVVKEIVELLQGFKLRYTRKQQYLSDFFELLLTTGLKQESGQFFTPVPVAQFILKSLPLDEIVEEKLKTATIGKENLLPYIMDYAAGSGHFVTEAMHEIQRLIDKKNEKEYHKEVGKKITRWQQEHFDWAIDYIYGIEKDYRLVKVGKVGCYLHGDGLANVIHSDGLSRFEHPDYKGKLLTKDKDFPKENKQFDIIVSNPPYSVSAFKNNASKYYNENDFELYNALTDNSSEIECLFIERTKQLLKDDGIAGIILPSSILSNAGIYTKAREIILHFFEIIAITELGSNTFMATGTNTVVLFLRRRNNYKVAEFTNYINDFHKQYTDRTINGTECVVLKYVNHVFENISFEDYVSLCKKTPNDNIQNNEIYKEYRSKLKFKTEQDFWKQVLELEKEKLLYFVLTYPQKIVLVKSGEKDAEKRFLGYEFSNRRGSEGIHPIQRGKTIDKCTQLFDAKKFDNDKKASFYVYSAFKKQFPAIDELLQKNISYINLVDALTFDRVDFEKTISTAVKKKVKIVSKWEMARLDEVAKTIKGVTYSKEEQTSNITENIILTADNITLDGNFEIKKQVFLNNTFKISDEKKLRKDDIFMCFSSGSKAHLGKVAFIENDTNYFAGGFMGIIRAKSNIHSKYLFQVLNSLLRQSIRDFGTGSNINNLSNIINSVTIPLPPLDIQQKIVAEIEQIENKEKTAKEKIAELKGEIENIISSCKTNFAKLEDVLTLEYGNALPEQNRIDGEFPVMGSNGIVGYHNSFLVESPAIIVGRKGSAGKIVWIDKNCFPIDTTFFIKLKDKNNSLKLIYYFLKQLNLEKISGGTGVPGLNRNEAYQKQIPLPTISEQQKIVAKIEKIEIQIATLEQALASMKAEKEEVLEKHL